MQVSQRSMCKIAQRVAQCFATISHVKKTAKKQEKAEESKEAGGYAPSRRRISRAGIRRGDASKVCTSVQEHSRHTGCCDDMTTANIAQCPVCKGTGTASRAMVCPRCDGDGILDAKVIAAEHRGRQHEQNTDSSASG